MFSLVKTLWGSLYIKLVCIFFAVWIPFCLFAWGVLFFSSNRLTRETLENEKEMLTFYVNNIDRDLKKVSQLAQSLCYDRELLKCANLERANYDYDQYITITSAAEKLNLVVKSSSYVEDAFLLLPNTMESVSALKGMGKYSKIQKDIEAELALLENNQSVMRYIDGMMLCIESYNDLVIAAIISTKTIKSMLETYIDDEVYNFLVTDTKSGEVICTDVGRGEAEALLKTMTISEKQNAPVFFEGKQMETRRFSSYGDSIEIFTVAPREKIYKDIAAVQGLFVVLNLFAIFLPVVMVLQARRVLHDPMRQLLFAIKKIESGDYSYRLSLPAHSEMSYVFESFNHMTQKLENLIDQVLKQDIHLKEVQLQQLQARINPHFLYNSLYIGYRMSRDGQSEKCAELCMYLGDYFKFITHLSQHKITLGDELRFIETYLKLNQFRFPDRLLYEVDIDPAIAQHIVLNLIIHPLVENAICHGVEGVRGECLIRVTVKQQNTGRILVVVSDNGVGMTVQQLENLQKSFNLETRPTKSYGIWNINSRLQNSYGKASGLHYAMENGRLLAYFSIPSELQEENHVI